MKLATQNLQIQASNFEVLAAGFVHQLTMLQDDANKAALAGTTVWSNPTCGGVVFWKWVMTSEGIIVVDDPCQIRSSILFVDGQAVLPFDRQLTSINEIVNRLPWQAPVAGHLQRLGITQGSSLPSRSRARASARAVVQQPLAV